MLNKGCVLISSAHRQMAPLPKEHTEGLAPSSQTFALRNANIPCTPGKTLPQPSKKLCQLVLSGDTQLQ